MEEPAGESSMEETVPLPSAAGVTAVAVPVTGRDARPLLSRRVAVKTGRGRVTTEAVPGFEAAITVPEGQMVGIEWRDAPVGVVELRARTNGTWGAWIELEADPDTAPDPSSREGSVVRSTAVGPVWTGSGTQAVELRVRAGRLADLRVDVLRTHGTVTPTAISSPPSAAPTECSSGGRCSVTAVASGPTGPAQPAVLRHSVTEPGIRPRSAWGAGPWQCSGWPPTSPLRNAIVHHTTSGNNYTQSEVDDVLRGVYYFHTQTLGWCDISYNFLVDRFGGMWEGRTGSISSQVIGGHARGFNTGSVGVAVIGNYDGVTLPSAALTGLGTVLRQRLGQAGIFPNGIVTVQSAGSSRYPAGRMVNLPTISGHQDSSLTACPGTGIYYRLADLRNLLQHDLPSSTTAPSPSSGVTAPSAVPPLRRGHVGPRVKQLQDALNYSTGSRLSGDGLFGAGTEQALKNFQLWYRVLKDRGLVVDGMYGKRSHLWLQYASNIKNR